jgi:hypothetical protein
MKDKTKWAKSLTAEQRRKIIETWPRPYGALTAR